MAKKPIVIGTIGSTHGVRFSARPPRKSARSATGKLKVANDAMKPPLPAAAAPFFGAEVSGVKPADEPAGAGVDDDGPVAPAAVTAAAISASAVLGGRQTLSLQA